MRALVQRVSRANVDINEETVGEIGRGALIFVCAMQDSLDEDASKLASKISKLRIFRDEEGRMNRSIKDIDGQALVVSQFTLAADTSRGNRPGFSSAAAPEEGRRLYEFFVDRLKSEGISVATGEFGADMAVALINDGPTTIWIDTKST